MWYYDEIILFPDLWIISRSHKEHHSHLPNECEVDLFFEERQKRVLYGWELLKGTVERLGGLASRNSQSTENADLIS